MQQEKCAKINHSVESADPSNQPLQMSCTIYRDVIFWHKVGQFSPKQCKYGDFFQIRVSTFWLPKQNCTECYLKKRPGCVPFGANLTQVEPKSGGKTNLQCCNYFTRLPCYTLCYTIRIYLDIRFIYQLNITTRCYLCILINGFWLGNSIIDHR